MSKTILVVDDSATVRQQVRLALEHVGFAVEEAVDGQEALTKLGPGIAAVVCDINMPRMNGVEFVEEVSKTPALAGLPILMLTTEGAPELIKRAKAAGAKGWMVKPFRADLLTAAIRKLTGA